MTVHMVYISEGGPCVLSTGKNTNLWALFSCRFFPHGMPVAEERLLDALGHTAMVGYVRDLVFVGAHEQDGRGLEVVVGGYGPGVDYNRVDPQFDVFLALLRIGQPRHHAEAHQIEAVLVHEEPVHRSEHPLAPEVDQRDRQLLVDIEPLSSIIIVRMKNYLAVQRFGRLALERWQQQSGTIIGTSTTNTTICYYHNILLVIVSSYHTCIYCIFTYSLRIFSVVRHSRDTRARR